MARILFALPRFHTNLWFAARAMRKAGHDLLFLVNQSAPGEEHSHVNPTVLGRYPEPDQVAAAFDAFKPDLAIVRNAWAVSRHVSKIAKARQVPRLLYNLTPATRPTGWRRRLELMAKRLPMHRITPVPGLPGTGQADPYATFLPWPTGFVAPDPLPRKPNARLALLCVGKLGMPRKQHKWVVDMIEGAQLQDKVRLVFVGSRPGHPDENAYYQEIKRLADRPWIDLYENVPFLDMPTHNAAADICILPSRAEPLGVAPLEAMRYGAIPFISDECGSAGYVREGENGHILQLDHPDRSAALLRALCTDAALRERLSAAAVDTATQDLGEDRFVQSLSELLDRHRVA